MFLNMSTKEELQKIINENKGELPSFAWPGGYPIFYLDNNNSVLCPECANKTKNDEIFTITDYGINWEDPSLHCDNCSERIKSAYAEE